MSADQPGRPPHASVPLATYRVQLTPEFGFDDLAAAAPYLSSLGVSHVYCSPYLQAAPGSTHGYDVVDHQRVNEELGGGDAHRRMCAALDAAGLGQVLDIVPNHMATGVRRNVWWWDVLENGRSSAYASYFDVDWDPPEQKLRDTLLLPVLGDHYGRVLEAGEIQVRRAGGDLTVHYHEHQFPLALPSLDGLLSGAAERAGSAELESLAAALGRRPPSTATDRESVRERHRDKEVLRARLARACEEEPEVAAALDEAVKELNSDLDALDALLERQNYRLAFWRTGRQELNYRRFFDIDTLVGLRAEDPAVFVDTHRLVLQWVGEGVVDGLRVDHPDGLRDPEGYLRRLDEAGGGTWTVVEKILEPGERLPPTWPVAGTTGYDFLNRLTALYVDPAGEAPLTELYGELTGESCDYDEVVLEKKHKVMRDALAADVARLTALFVHVCERHRCFRDYTRRELDQVLREVIAAFPVYRTYVRAEEGVVTADDVKVVEAAVAAAASRRPDLDPGLFAFLADLLLLRASQDDVRPHAAPRRVEHELVMRFQQLTGPVMAKGVEDTAFYTFNRLVALNEVGGDPGRFGLSPEEFHRACQEAQARWPTAMVGSSTHDTKRGEDVRARLALLAELHEEWAAFARRWVDPHAAVDANAQYLFLQTVVGAWPLPRERAVAYMEKAAKEAKQHTSWVDPDPVYDTALAAHVEARLGNDDFVAAVEELVGALLPAARVTSLAQKLILLTAPGVPDLYQGSELWTLSLVDPDNRRPVDYPRRERLLAELGARPGTGVLAGMDEGGPKLLVVREALRLRRERPSAFAAGPAGAYRPLDVDGTRTAHVVAFSRGGEVATVVPRLLARLGDDWGDTTVVLPEGRWTNRLTGRELEGGRVATASLLSEFPVALLARTR